MNPPGLVDLGEGGCMCAACTFLPFADEGARRETLELLGDSMLGK